MKNKCTRRSLLFIPLFSVLVISCSIPKHATHCGIVISKIKFYNPILRKYVRSETFGPDIKVWFKDSTVIVKTMGISINRDTNNIETRSVYVAYYTYVDLTKMVFYKYANFSDTAKIIVRYTEAQSDSVFWNVNWKFYKRNDIAHTGPIENMSDTIMNNRTYKRLKLTEKPTNDSTDFQATIVYFDCARKGTIFQYDKHLSEQVGCPMVAYNELPTAKFPRTLSCEIEFVTDKLTPEELKVFDAWEKNVKKYLVKQQ